MPETLRDRIRGSADGERPPVPDLARVAGRARTLRIRRAIGGVVALALACAAVAVPLVALRDLGDGRTDRPRPAGPRFGDGTVSFRPVEGWTRLQGGMLSACATTATFADWDVQQSRDLGDRTWLGCSASAGELPPGGVLISVYASDAYRWERPNVNFPEGTLPPVIDQRRCGVATYEGQAPGTTECVFGITANDRQLGVTVWLADESPDPELMATARSGLDALEVSAPASLGNDIAFEPARGWFDHATAPTTVGGRFYEHATAWTSTVEPDGSSPAGLSNDDIRRLPPDGVIVSVEQVISTRNELPDTEDYQPLPDRPVLSQARLVTGGWEGMPAEDVARLYLSGVLNGRPVVVQAYFRTTDPGPDLIKEAQFGLNRLIVVPSPAPTREIDDFGIGMELPDGWNGRLFAFFDAPPMLIATTSERVNLLSPSSVVRTLGPAEAAIVLGEGTGLQDLRWPAIDGPPQIGPDNLCAGCEMMDGGRPPEPGHALYHHTFTSGGRPFDLYVEFGSSPSDRQLADVNTVLRTLRFVPDPDPDPDPAPAGGTAVGSLYEGAGPAVGPGDADRTLTWYAAKGVTMTVPDGWTGWTYLVSDTSDPLNLFAAGSWNVPQGGYCAPLMALQQLPSDGALVWIDRLQQPPEGVAPSPWPSSPQVGPGTEPAPAPTPCTAGAPVQSFLWSSDGRTYAVHVAFGPDVTDANLQAADRALASLTTLRR